MGGMVRHAVVPDLDRKEVLYHSIILFWLTSCTSVLCLTSSAQPWEIVANVIILTSPLPEEMSRKFKIALSMCETIHLRGQENTKRCAFQPGL